MNSNGICFRIYRGEFMIASERRFLREIREIAERFGCYIVFLDRKAIAGPRHIEASVSMAARSFFGREDPISNSFEMEVLLYTFGTRQTGYASGLGLHRGFNDSIICICGRKSVMEDLKGAIEKNTEVKKTEFQREYDSSFELIADAVAGEISTFEECSSISLHPKTAADFFGNQGENRDEKIENLKEVFGITNAEIEICGEEKIEELVVERCALLDVNR